MAPIEEPWTDSRVKLRCQEPFAKALNEGIEGIEGIEGMG